MSTVSSLDSVGYCGLVCAICRRSDDGCPGCRSGGGNIHCFQRTCCEGKRLDGCWQCIDFPCNQGYFAADEWRGLCLACVQGIRLYGVEGFISRARRRFGDMVAYEDFRFKDAGAIRQML
jgi:hypothetical protein